MFVHTDYLSNKKFQKIKKKHSVKVAQVEGQLAVEGFTVHQVFFLEVVSGPEKDLPNLDVSVSMFSPSSGE